MDLRLLKFRQLFALNRIVEPVRSSGCKRLYLLETIYLSTYIILQMPLCKQRNYPFCSYLDCLPCLEERFVRIGYVFQRDSIELTLVDVRYSVVLAALRRADRRLQVILESVIRETERQTNKIPQMRREYTAPTYARAHKNKICLRSNLHGHYAVGRFTLGQEIESRLLNRRLRARKRMLN